MKIQYVIAKIENGVKKVVGKQNVSDSDAELIVKQIVPDQLSAVTPYLRMKDSGSGVVITGPTVGQLLRIFSQSHLLESDKFSFYLLHRTAQAILFIRSQTNEKVAQGYIDSLKLSSETGRLDRKSFDNFMARQGSVNPATLWSNLSAYLKKMDQAYMDKQPMYDMAMRTIARFSPDYSPYLDSIVSLPDGVKDYKGDLLIIGGIVDDAGSITTVLLEDDHAYTKSVIKEGYVTDSASQRSLVNFIDNDPFVKAAYMTSKTSLDGVGLQTQKTDVPEEVVKQALITVESKQDKDVYGNDSYWLEWWLEKNKK